MESEDQCQHHIPGDPNPGTDAVLQGESEKMSGSTSAFRMVSKIQKYALTDHKFVGKMQIKEKC